MTHLDHRPATPAEALAELLDGNRRFVAGTPVHPNQDAQRRAALAAEQRPFAVVFGCADSRLAAEIIFDRGLGDLFVVRTAGHVVGPEVCSSVEYGVSVLGAPLVVVLGHDSCGAVAATRAALGSAEPSDPGLRAIVDRVAPSVRAAEADRVTDPDGIGAIHVQRTVEHLRIRGTGLASAVTEGRCAVVGAFYRLADGQVTVLPGGHGPPGEG